MELLAEIFIVVGVMLPGALLALSSGLHGHILNAVIKAGISVGLGLVAAGILMLRRQRRGVPPPAP